MPNPRVSLRRDQLILGNKVVNGKGQLEKGLEEKKEAAGSGLLDSRFLVDFQMADRQNSEIKIADNKCRLN
jgi:hypothetical protein